MNNLEELESNDCLWVAKFRPQTVNDMCLEPSLATLFNSYVDGTKTMQHLTLGGPRGIGKTTLAMILANALSEDIKFWKTGANGSVDDIRGSLTDFCVSNSFDGRNKTVIIDEADGLSRGTGNGSSAQDALRGLIEETEHNTRFILTCNYINKIDDPILSRCTPVALRFNSGDILKKCISILDTEKISYTKEVLQAFHAKVIEKNFPDIRACINVMYMWTMNGQLLETNITTDEEVGKFVAKLILQCKTKKFQEARQTWLDNESLFFSYEELAAQLFERLPDLRMRMKIGKHLAEMPHVLDKEINFTCLIYDLFSD